METGARLPVLLPFWATRWTPVWQSRAMVDSFRTRLALSGLASVLARLFSALGTFFCSRLLTAQEFGRLSLWQATLASAVTFGTVGLGVATNSLIARSKHREPGETR